MTLEKGSSERIDCLRFPLIVGVVFIHCYGAVSGTMNSTHEPAATYRISIFIMDLISQGIARTAVPLFFLLSGYLFFLDWKWSFDGYKKKLSSRISTLLIPFLFWNSLVLLLYGVVQLTPGLAGYNPGKENLVSGYGLYDYVNALVGIDRFPVAYQFWFIRDLMVMVLFVPLLNFLLKTIPFLFLGVISFLWFFGDWPFSIPCAPAVLFFSTGAYIACKKKDIFMLEKWTYAILGIYLLLLPADVLTRGDWYHGYIHKGCISFGVATALCISKICIENKRVREKLLRAGSCSFFVFAVHEPLLTVLRKIVYLFLKPAGDTGVLGVYFLLPLLVIAMSLFACSALRKGTPECFRFVTGGR